MVDTRNVDMDKEDVDLICALIEGKKESVSGIAEKAWMFDIINNKRNSIDVDKFDYILRDTT